MKTRKPKRTCFLSLPGEIRNHVYSYCFDDTYVDLTPNANHVLTLPSPKKVNVNKPKPHRVRVKKPLGRYIRAKCIQTDWQKSYSGAGLSLTCKQIRFETMDLYYAAPVFIASSPNRLLKFLTVVPTEELALIKKIHVCYATYGTPEYTKHDIWKTRHDEKWLKVMQIAAAKLTGLELLSFRVVPNEFPTLFNLSQPWVEALLAFAPACSTSSVPLTVTSQNPTDKKPVEARINLQLPMLHDKANLNPAIQHVWLHLRKCFVEALRRRLTGMALEDAMTAYEAARKEKYDFLRSRQWDSVLP